MTPVLFRYGIDVLAGSAVMDPDSIRQVVQEGGSREIFQRGALMVKASRDDTLQIDMGLGERHE